MSQILRKSGPRNGAVHCLAQAEYENASYRFSLRLFLQILLFNHRLEPYNRLLLVGVLAAFFSTDDSLFSRQIDCPDAGLYLVYILPTFAAAAEGLKHYLLRVEFVTLRHGTSTKVDELILTFVLRAIGTAAYPLNGTHIFREIVFRKDADRLKGISSVILTLYRNQMEFLS